MAQPVAAKAPIYACDIQPGTKVALFNKGEKIIRGELVLPDGSRIELSPEALGNRN